MPVAEAALAYVAMKVLEQLEGELGGAASRQVRAWFKRDPQRLACEVALADTERSFAARHPDWHASLFDAHFLSASAAPLLARSLTLGADAIAAELAAAWAAEVGGETGARHLGAVTPAAAELLGIWREELGRHAVFQPILDSAALDKLAAAADAGAPADLERSLLRARYPKLEDHVDWPSRQAARSPGTFVGRAWAFERLEQLAGASRAAYLHVVADAGLGKTALAIALAARCGAPLYLFNDREGRVRGDRCLDHLCAELIDRHGLAHDHLPARAGEDSGMLERLLEEAPKPVWVVIDALDEAAELPLPEKLPDGVFVVLTHRPGGYGPAARPGTGQHELWIRADARGQRDDLADYLRLRAEERPCTHGPRQARRHPGRVRRAAVRRQRGQLHVRRIRPRRPARRRGARAAPGRASARSGQVLRADVEDDRARRRRPVGRAPGRGDRTAGGRGRARHAGLARGGDRAPGARDQAARAAAVAPLPARGRRRLADRAQVVQRLPGRGRRARPRERAWCGRRALPLSLERLRRASPRHAPALRGRVGRTARARRAPRLARGAAARRPERGALPRGRRACVGGGVRRRPRGGGGRRAAAAPAARDHVRADRRRAADVRARAAARAAAAAARDAGMEARAGAQRCAERRRPGRAPYGAGCAAARARRPGPRGGAPAAPRGAGRARRGRARGAGAGGAAGGRRGGRRDRR